MRFGAWGPLVALALLAALASDSWGQSKRPNQPPQSQPAQQQTATDQRGTESSPVVVKVLPAQENEEKAKADAKEHDEKRELDRDTIRLSIATVVIIFLQLLIFIAQAYFLWGTLRATAVAATAAKNAAETIPNMERAYLFFSATTCDEFRPDMSFAGTSPDVFKIAYRYRNNGRTPALLTRVQTGTGYLRDGFPKKDAFVFDHVLPTVAAIAADTEPPANTVEIELMGDEYENAKKGIGRIFFWAKLTYFDVFRASHETAICAEWHFGQSRFVVSKTNELNYYT